MGAHLSFNRVGIQKKPFFLFWYLNARPHLVLFINHSRRLVSARTNLNARVGKARKSGGDKQTFNDLPHDEAHALLFLQYYAVYSGLDGQNMSKDNVSSTKQLVL